MYRNLLVATDGSELSKRAIACAVELARTLGARLTLFHALPDRVNEAHLDGVNLDAKARDKYAKTDAARAEKILAAGKAQVKTGGVECAVAQAVTLAPHQGILAAARKQQCDAIVMASHGRRGVSALLLGSETQKVLAETSLPVLVVR